MYLRKKNKMKKKASIFIIQIGIFNIESVIIDIYLKKFKYGFFICKKIFSMVK